MTDNSEPGRRDFLNSEDPDTMGDESEALPRRTARPEQDEAQLSAALGNAIDQIWSELDGLQRDREAEGRASVRLPQADVPNFLRSERSRETRRERPADFSPAARQRRSRRFSDDEGFGRENREKRESARPPWREDQPAKSHLPAKFPALDDLEVEEVRKRQGGPIVAGVLVAFMLAGGVVVVATNVWSLRDSVLGLAPDEGSETVAASTAPQPTEPEPEAAQGQQTAALPPTSAKSLPPPKFVDKPVKGTAGTTVELGLPAPAEPESAQIRLEGLPASARLSAGREVSAGVWSVPGTELAALTVKTPPEGFGAFEVNAFLERDTGERQPLGHIWLVLTSPPPPLPSPPPEPAPQGAAIAATRAPQAETAGLNPAAAPAPSAPDEDQKELALAPPNTAERAPRGLPSRPTARLSAEEIQDLLTRGTKFFGEGNMAPARLLFRRAADAGEPLGLLLLGMTYDPLEYERRGVVGLSADGDRAMEYYERARAAGVKEAVQRINKLDEWRLQTAGPG